MTAVSSRSLVLACAALVAAAPAHAQVANEAGELFKQGRAQFKAGKFAEACLLFHHSQDLDPQIGTLFNIAQCEEKTGKLASALAAYREVAAKDTNAQRRALAASDADALAPRVPKLVVLVDRAPPGLVVTVDGPTGAKPITASQPVELDLGDYKISAVATGFRQADTTAKIANEGETTTVTLALEPLPTGEPATALPPTTPSGAPAAAASDGTAVMLLPAVAPTPATSRKRYGEIGVVGGGVAIAAGAVFGALASSKWSDAKNVCGGTVCPTQAQVASANSLADKARTDGSVSTGLFVAGGILAAAGVALWVTAPSSEHAVHVSVGAGDVSLSAKF